MISFLAHDLQERVRQFFKHIVGMNWLPFCHCFPILFRYNQKQNYLYAIVSTLFKLLCGLLGHTFLLLFQVNFIK